MSHRYNGWWRIMRSRICKIFIPRWEKACESHRLRSLIDVKNWRSVSFTRVSFHIFFRQSKFTTTKKIHIKSCMRYSFMAWVFRVNWFSLYSIPSRRSDFKLYGWKGVWHRRESSMLEILSWASDMDVGQNFSLIESNTGDCVLKQTVTNRNKHDHHSA